MIRKFAAVPVLGTALTAAFLLIAGTFPLRAQQTPDPAQPPQAPQTQQPATQQPSTQQPSGQEASEEEIGAKRKTKPILYNKYSFNVGGGASMTSGTTGQFVRGGGGIAAVGAARNYSQYFGLRVDFQFDNLPLRTSALELAQAPGASSHVYSLMGGPVINIPASKNWGGYIVFGPGYFHRSGKLDSSQVIPGSACNNFFAWWGTCFNGSIPLNKQYLSTSQNEFGYFVGGGITRRLTPKFELYGEYRLVHASGGGRTTDFRPITVGLRW